MSQGANSKKQLENSLICCRDMPKNPRHTCISVGAQLISAVLASTVFKLVAIICF